MFNPITFNDDNEVEHNLATWLDGAEFRRDPTVSRREALFERKTQGLDELAWTALDVIAALSTGPGAELLYEKVLAEFRAVLFIEGQAPHPFDAIFNDLLNVRRIIERRIVQDRSLIWIDPAYYSLVVAALRDRQ